MAYIIQKNAYFLLISISLEQKELTGRGGVWKNCENGACISDVLGISPSKEKFIKALNSTLRGIPSVLCSNAVPMDGSVCEPQTDLDDTESSPLKSDNTKSLSDYK